MTLGNDAPHGKRRGGHPAGPGNVLGTNAPRNWPQVQAPPREGDEEGRSTVGAIKRAVATALLKRGFQVRSAGVIVEISSQSVRVDLVVDDGRGERPVFIFPGADPGREGTMFQFLYALMEEADAFPQAPVYYAPSELPYAPGTRVAAVVDAATRFEQRAHEAGLDFGLDMSAEDLVAVLRDIAAAPVESGGAEIITEAAAFTGCWLLQHVEGRWELKEDLPRTVLLLRSHDGSVIYEVPLFAFFPDAVRTGYDGLPQLLEGILRDLSPAARVMKAERLTFFPEHLSPVVQGWLTENLFMGFEEHAAILARRCASCGELVAMEALPQVPVENGSGALQAALVLAAPEAPPCPHCGSALHSGTLAGYLMPEEDGDGAAFLVTAYVSSTYLRVSFHHIDEEGIAVPVGALP